MFFKGQIVSVWYEPCLLALVNSALHPSGVAKSSTSFGWSKGGKVTSAGWQVTLCDLIWHVISRSGVVISITNCYIRLTLLLSVSVFYRSPITYFMSKINDDDDDDSDGESERERESESSCHNTVSTITCQYAFYLLTQCRRQTNAAVVSVVNHSLSSRSWCVRLWARCRASCCCCCCCCVEGCGWRVQSAMSDARRSVIMSMYIAVVSATTIDVAVLVLPLQLARRN